MLTLESKEVLWLARKWAITKDCALNFLLQKTPSDEAKAVPIEPPHYQHTSQLKVKTEAVAPAPAPVAEAPTKKKGSK